jgi:Domain of unknown function (DUF1707)
VSDDVPARPPGVRAADSDRDAVVARLQAAMAEGRLDLDEFGQRASAAYAAVTLDELDALLADLPRNVPTEIVGTRTPDTITSILGDVRIAGASPPYRVSTVLGDVRIDLRAVRTDAPRIELFLRTVIGDVEVIVAEGVDAELHGGTVLGDRKVELAPVPRLAGTPRVIVHGRTTFGDLRLRSLAPGESASRWKAVLDRLAQGRPPLPPGS